MTNKTCFREPRCLGADGFSWPVRVVIPLRGGTAEIVFIVPRPASLRQLVEVRS